MKTNINHQIKCTDKTGKSCTVSVSTTNPEPLSRNVVRYITNSNLVVDTISTTSIPERHTKAFD